MTASPSSRTAGPADVPAGYDPATYPPFAVTADIVLLTVRDGRLQVLLVQRADAPHAGSWALPGGFVGVDEDATAAAYRELAEETGVDAATLGYHLEQLATFSAPDRDPRMRVVSVAHVAFVPDVPLPTAGSDATNARFFAVDDLDLPGLPAVAPDEDRVPLAFDHAAIVAAGVERARSKLEWTTLATSFLPATFTLAELQRVYEAVWGAPLSRPGFHRKAKTADGFVEPADGTTATGGRPAQLYRAGTAARLEPPLTRPEPDR